MSPLGNSTRSQACQHYWTSISVQHVYQGRCRLNSLRTSDDRPRSGLTIADAVRFRNVVHIVRQIYCRVSYRTGIFRHRLLTDRVVQQDRESEDSAGQGVVRPDERPFHVDQYHQQFTLRDHVVVVLNAVCCKNESPSALRNGAKLVERTGLTPCRSSNDHYSRYQNIFDPVDHLLDVSPSESTRRHGAVCHLNMTITCLRRIFGKLAGHCDPPEPCSNHLSELDLKGIILLVSRNLMKNRFIPPIG